jgi:hypothetical protein
MALAPNLARKNNHLFQIGAIQRQYEEGDDGFWNLHSYILLCSDSQPLPGTTLHCIWHKEVFHRSEGITWKQAHHKVIIGQQRRINEGLTSCAVKYTVFFVFLYQPSPHHGEENVANGFASNCKIHKKFENFKLRKKFPNLPRKAGKILQFVSYYVKWLSKDGWSYSNTDPHYSYNSFSAFAKLRNAATSFLMSVCPSVHPYGTTRLPPNEFSWNLIFE